MAPGPKSLQPPGTPPTPVFATGQQGEPSFHFVCDDFDLDQQQSDQNHPNNNPEGTIRTQPPEVAPFPSPGHQYLAPSPRSSPAAFLDPYSHHQTSLRPPTPDHLFNSMSSEGGLAANGGDAPALKNPFNFQTQIISSGPVKSNIGQRRGHRYKHSSISATHQIFQEPPPDHPPMQRDQKARLWWCSLHALIALYVFLSAEGSLAMTALSHLVFFDVGSAAVCVAVDVLGNFEVWRRSSIRHPFGLQRAEVLAGFAMSVFLVFGGFDLISHSLKDVLESVGHHESHHPVSSSDTQPSGHGHGHGTRYIPPGTLDFASFAAFISTLVSAYGLRNHGRIRRVMRVPLPYLSSLLPEAAILANPFHFLTLFFSGIMLVLPLVYIPHIIWLDRLICATISLSMFFLGTRLAVGQGFMLLMSYNHVSSSPSASQKSSSGKESSGVASVIREIESEPQVARVEEAQFWQVHYGLAMANLKVLVKNGNTGGGGMGGGERDGAISQLRGRLARVVQNRLGEGYGRGGSLRWEVTVQMSTAD
ncbi:cation efflux family-domain-containing protein [Apiosordaria backusii]|uniref:Zinc transporter n=1 Tax=Apiosordaria backusii TaxID=314023 RepID=A0AA40EBR0_9PEZI|nr:cation efflux family-domain-containing protein [Apiosordaria backusii]